MIARDLIDHVRIRDVGEGAGSPCHPQILKTVLRQHGQARLLTFREDRLESNDPAVEDGVLAELDREWLAEIQGCSIEVQESDGVVPGSPVAELRLTAVQTGGLLADGQTQQTISQIGIDAL